MQAALARLCTDAAARAELRSEPVEFGKRWEMSIAETKALVEAVGGEVEQFAQSLRRKRLREAARSMPLTVQTLGAQFAPLFEKYGDAVPLGSFRKPELDALAFLQSILSQTTPPLAAPKRDLLRFEAGWLTMRHTPQRFLIRWLAVPHSSRGVSSSVAVWWRWRGRLRHWVSG